MRGLRSTASRVRARHYWGTLNWQNAAIQRRRSAVLRNTNSLRDGAVDAPSGYKWVAVPRHARVGIVAAALRHRQHEHVVGLADLDHARSPCWRGVVEVRLTVTRWRGGRGGRHNG